MQNGTGMCDTQMYNEHNNISWDFAEKSKTQSLGCMLRLRAEQSPAEETTEWKELFHCPPASSCFTSAGSIIIQPSRGSEGVCERWKRVFSYPISLLHSVCVCVCAVVNRTFLYCLKFTLLQSDLLPEVNTLTWLISERTRHSGLTLQAALPHSPSPCVTLLSLLPRLSLSLGRCLKTGGFSTMWKKKLRISRDRASSWNGTVL